MAAARRCGGPRTARDGQKILLAASKVPCGIRGLGAKFMGNLRERRAHSPVFPRSLTKTRQSAGGRPVRGRDGPARWAARESASKRSGHERWSDSTAAPPRLFVAGAIFFPVGAAVRARRPRHHLWRLCGREQDHAGRSGGAVHLWRHGGERFRPLRDRRRRAPLAVAHPARGRRPGQELRRYGQAQSVRAGGALPRRPRRRLHRLRRMRLEPGAARPVHGGEPGRFRPLSAAHALHRGVLRRCARRSGRVLDLAIPAVRAGRHRVRASASLRVPTITHSGRGRTVGARRYPRRSSRGAHPGGAVLPAARPQLDLARVAPSLVDAADRRQSTRCPARPAGRIEKRSLARRRRAAPRTLYTDLERARQALCSAELAFPLVATPDVGRRGACRIDDISALRDYLRQFPPGEKLILQRFVSCEGEASVLYARLPGAQHGRILSLLVRTGDGYRDGRRYITPKLEARLDAIAQGMREFHYGRFDLRFASADELVRGEGFSIVDIKGIGRGANEVWDASLPFAEIYRGLIDRQRIMFLIGEKNRARGFEPVGCAGFLTSMVRQSQLGRRYPASA